MAPKPVPDYPPGTIVFAKLRGYPWWPARVEDESKLPSKVQKQKGNTKGPMWTVFFFGSKDYGFFGPDSIRPFDHEAVERDLKANKFKTKDLTVAIKQALDPIEFDKEVKEMKEAQRKEDEQERKETSKSKKKAPIKKESPPAKKAPASKSKAAAEPKPKAASKQSKATESKPAGIIAPTTSRKRRGTQTQDQQDATDNPRDTKRSRTTGPAKDATTAEPVTNGDKTLATTLKTNDKDQVKPSRSPEPGSGKENSEAKKSQKKLYHLRHKLQRLVYEKKEEVITLDDYTKIDAVLSEIEGLQSEVTYEILKETKIGKVMKNACSHTFANDTKYKLRDRCVQLMKKWKVVLLAGSAEEKSEAKKAEKANDASETSVEPAKEASNDHVVEPPKVAKPEQLAEAAQSLVETEQANTSQNEQITKDVAMPYVPTQEVVEEKQTIVEQQVTSNVTDGKDVIIQEAAAQQQIEATHIDTIMEENSNADLPSSVVSQTAMDLGTDPTLDLLGQST
ncbi:hypothetical protein Unana1_02643 [Umbelopsis nana]